MKTRKEVEEELGFQEQQMEKHRNIAKQANSTTMSGKLKRTMQFEVATRHAARAQALRWVLSGKDAS